MAIGLTGRFGLAGEGQPAPPPCDESGGPGRHHRGHRGTYDGEGVGTSNPVGWHEIRWDGTLSLCRLRPPVTVTTLAAV